VSCILHSVLISIVVVVVEGGSTSLLLLFYVLIWVVVVVSSSFVRVFYCYSLRFGYSEFLRIMLRWSCSVMFTVSVMLWRAFPFWPPRGACCTQRYNDCKVLQLISLAKQKGSFPVRYNSFSDNHAIN